MPIHLFITALGAGEKISHLRVQAQTPDGVDVPPAEFLASTYTIASLRAHPRDAWFILHQEELSSPLKHTVVLADLWPGNGLSIKSITSTLGDKLRYQLVPTGGDILIGPSRFKKRYKLELSLSLDSTQTAFDHTVTITPDHPKAKPVAVRLYGKIIPRCGLDADSLAFCGASPGASMTRRIEYHYRDTSDQEIRLVKAPAWLKSSVSETAKGVKTITLTCHLPECEGTRVEQAYFVFGRDKKRIILPIFISCAAESGAPNGAKHPG